MSDDTATISIHAAREGSDLAYGVVITRLTISIHAAREGGDASSSYSNGVLRISIHAAREGGDDCVGSRGYGNRYFNPRRP